MLRDAFENRVLPFDSDAAHAYADIAAMRRSAAPSPSHRRTARSRQSPAPAAWRWRHGTSVTSRKWG